MWDLLRNPKIPILVIPISTITAKERYDLINKLARFQFLCSQTAAMILPISSTIPIITTEINDPGKIVAKPNILKYAATHEMLSAETKVVIANTITGITLYYII
tara:strand:- start:33325 stop:33636 length:312 start_codon:yes stop_codon:yes gene_type:complete